MTKKHEDECGCGEDCNCDDDCSSNDDCGCGCGEDHGHSHGITVDQLAAQNSFLLHMLIDLMIEKQLISREELQDKIDRIESEFFVNEQDKSGKAAKEGNHKESAHKHK